MLTASYLAPYSGFLWVFIGNINKKNRRIYFYRTSADYSCPDSWCLRCDCLSTRTFPVWLVTDVSLRQSNLLLFHSFVWADVCCPLQDVWNCSPWLKVPLCRRANSVINDVDISSETLINNKIWDLPFILLHRMYHTNQR